ncbi:MAG: hypothetical protein K6F92_05685 [Lachnospiraceae bacterium]|nr:hypothetical protein [Lachnospiraceae bacterium]
MTGFKEAIREYVLKRKYNRIFLVFTVLSFFVISVSWYYYPIAIIAYSGMSIILIVPSAPIEYMLPLSEEELRKKYINMVTCKQIKIMVYMAVAIVVGCIIDREGFGNVWRTYPEYMMMLTGMLVFFAFFTNISTMGDNLFYKNGSGLVSRFKEDKVNFVGNIGMFLCFLSIGRYYLHLDRVIHGTYETYNIDMIIMLASGVLLITGIVGVLRRKTIKDYIGVNSIF